MLFGLSSGLTSLASGASETTAAPTSSLFGMLGNRDGVAIDFRNRVMRINDAANPANNFTGHPEVKLHNFGSDGILYTPGLGVNIDGARDFSIGLSTDLFPHNRLACSVYVRYSLNAASSDQQRYLWMTDNGGLNRFATYSTPGQAFRYITGDGSETELVVSTTDPIANVERVAVFGCDEYGMTYWDDGGIQKDSSEVLWTSKPDYVGIGGYNDRVLRVLDGHIAEIVIVTEPVPRAERLKGDLYPITTVSTPPIFEKLGTRDGFAIDFRTGQMKVNDLATPANSYEGAMEAKLTKLGADPWQIDPVRGLDLSAARDFAVAFDTSLFPYDPNACTVYARYWVNSEIGSDQRYVFMADNTGEDRLALYSANQSFFRFVTGDGTTSDIAVSDVDHLPNTEYEVLFGADANGKTLVDGGGVHSDTAATLDASIPSAVGIGGYPTQVFRVLDGHITEMLMITEPLPRGARNQTVDLAKVYKAEGDSHTFNTSFGLAETDFYPARVASALGVGFHAESFGTSGDSSAEMVNQIPDFFVSGRPDVVSIYAGSNDVNPAVITDGTTPTTTEMTIGNAAKFAVDGWLLINGESVQITNVASSTLTVAPALSSAPTVGDLVEIDTEKNIRVWVQAMKSAGIDKILVIGAHYRNFTSSGDTPTSEQSVAAGIRQKASAAATAENVVYVDTYTHMREKITSGAVTQGDDLSWHVAIANSHLNAAGEQAVADAVADAIVAEGWD